MRPRSSPSWHWIHRQHGLTADRGVNANQAVGGGCVQNGVVRNAVGKNFIDRDLQRAREDVEAGEDIGSRRTARPRDIAQITAIEIDEIEDSLFVQLIGIIELESALSSRSSHSLVRSVSLLGCRKAIFFSSRELLRRIVSFRGNRFFLWLDERVPPPAIRRAGIGGEDWSRFNLMRHPARIKEPGAAQSIPFHWKPSVRPRQIPRRR